MATSRMVGAQRHSSSDIQVMTFPDRQKIGLQEWTEDPSRFNPDVQAWLFHPRRSELVLPESVQLAALDIEAGQYIYEIMNPTEAVQLEALRLDRANFYFIKHPTVHVQKTVLLERIRRGNFRVESLDDDCEDDDDRPAGYFRFTLAALNRLKHGLADMIERAAAVGADRGERASLVEDFMCATEVDAVELPAGELV